jgi:putative membrane protein
MIYMGDIYDFCADHYLWIKSLHIISMVAWMAGLLYLPRLFVYHAAATPGSELSETLKVMERRLFKFIMNPALIATFIFGLMLIAGYRDLLEQHWLHAKLTFVAILIGLHHVDGRLLRKFAKDQNTHSQKFFRIINEIPALLLVLIVSLVIVKPF